jgi:hypothetical protein
MAGARMLRRAVRAVRAGLRRSAPGCAGLPRRCTWLHPTPETTDDDHVAAATGTGQALI